PQRSGWTQNGPAPPNLLRPASRDARDVAVCWLPSSLVMASADRVPRHVGCVTRGSHGGTVVGSPRWEDVGAHRTPAATGVWTPAKEDGMNILVLGATGTAGRSAVPVFVSAGHTVRTHVRSDAGAAAMAAMRAEPVRADLEDDQRLRRIVEVSDAVVDLRVAIPATFGAALPWAWREYVRLRDRETRRLVDAALHAGTPRIVHDTVSMVYADGGDAELDEDSPVDAPGALAANLAAERHLARFTESGGTGVALRFGTFYGPHDEF